MAINVIYISHFERVPFTPNLLMFDVPLNGLHTSRFVYILFGQLLAAFLPLCPKIANKLPLLRIIPETMDDIHIFIRFHAFTATHKMSKIMTVLV